MPPAVTSSGVDTVPRDKKRSAGNHSPACGSAVFNGQLVVPAIKSYLYCSEVVRQSARVRLSFPRLEKPPFLDNVTTADGDRFGTDAKD
jgi:hypothetical protein